MKQLFIFLMILAAAGTTSAQMRCFEFKMNEATGDWRDTSCVACTADPAVLNAVQAELALPFAARGKHINGNIAAGPASVNRNAGHWFKWHFIPGQWALGEMSVEVCDGKPYTDVDADTAYWIHTVGYFCPWSFRVLREIVPMSITGPNTLSASIHPNPAQDHIRIVFGQAFRGAAGIFDPAGRPVWQATLDVRNGDQKTVELGTLPAGVYLLRLKGEDVQFSTKLVRE